MPLDAPIVSRMPSSLRTPVSVWQLVRQAEARGYWDQLWKWPEAYFRQCVGMTAGPGFVYCCGRGLECMWVCRKTQIRPHEV